MFSKVTPAGEEAAGARLAPGRALPHVTLPTTEGGRVEIGAPTGRWQMVVVGRGRHDPLVSKRWAWRREPARRKLSLISSSSRPNLTTTHPPTAGPDLLRRAPAPDVRV
jgi:hypothetical protein